MKQCSFILVSPTKVHKQVFQYISFKADKMHYWCGEAKDCNDATTNYGTQRSSSKEADFLGVLVRLKVGLFTQDTAARMQISTSQFTRTFTSWIRPLRLELETTCRFPVTKVATEVLGLTGSRGDLMKG